MWGRQTHVISVGGNALEVDGNGDIKSQRLAVLEPVAVIADLFRQGNRIALTHGNGPQVGNIAHRFAIAQAEGVLYQVPLDLIVADTQGGIASIFLQALHEELYDERTRLHRKIGGVVTMVEVDPMHPGFQKPTKPIGLELSPELIKKLQVPWDLIDYKDGKRRIVASPEPLDIIDIDLIRDLVKLGYLTICCGGGGIPVARHNGGKLVPLEAVIDKDRTTALLGIQMKADRVTTLTKPRGVIMDFDRDGPEGEIHKILKASHALGLGRELDDGGMGPKLEAAANFVMGRNASRWRGFRNKCAVITNAANVRRSFEGFGEGGTWIVPD